MSHPRFLSPETHRKLAEAQIRRLDRAKQSAPPAMPRLGPEMVQFFKQSVQKRQTRLSRIGESWEKLVPPMFTEHCALESLHRGSLTVLVDTAAHLYELKQLLLAGLQQQLLLACRTAGLSKIILKPGRWYEGGDDRDRRVKFS
jgi:hypothetical protein